MNETKSAEKAEQPKVGKWRRMLEKAVRPVAITGAGISVASGLPTVTAEWKGIELRDFFSREMFVSETEKFYRYYRHMLRHWQTARPNPAHLALAADGMPVITQNIDGLHIRAGSPHVLELHGNLLELACCRCDAIFSSDMAFQSEIPLCPSCKNLLKPRIVLVGEEVYHYGTAVDWVGKADLLLIVGTRLEMAPCHQLLAVAGRKGIPVIRVNRAAEKILPAILPRKPRTTGKTGNQR